MIKGCTFPAFCRVALRTVSRIPGRDVVRIVRAVEVVAVTAHAVRRNWPCAAFVALRAIEIAMAQRQWECRGVFEICAFPRSR